METEVSWGQDRYPRPQEDNPPPPGEPPVSASSLVLTSIGKRVRLVPLVAPALLLTLAACRAHTPPITLPDGRPDPAGIAVMETVELGGLEQWILIRGKRANAPVLLRLHGGPGAADMPVTRHFNRALEEHFVVVSWDQRGAGKSNPRSFDPGTMTFQRFMDDAHELTRHLQGRFEQPRIFLMGHSWGSQLGLRLVERHPEDYAGYIGVAQSVDQERALGVAHGWLVEQAEQAGDEATLQALADLGPPPYPVHADFVRFVRLLDRYGANVDVGFGTLAWVAMTAPEYSARDLARWLRGARRGSGPMWDEPAYRGFDAFTQIPHLRVPSHFFMGGRDMNTPLSLVEEYRNGLVDAEMASIVVFEGVGHTPFLANPERFTQEVVRALLGPDAPVTGSSEADRPRSSWAALPFAFYSPETRFGGGVYGSVHRRLGPDLPSSSLEVALSATARRQYVLDLFPSLHLQGGRRVDATLQVQEYPDRFFGVGPGVRSLDEGFTTRTLAARARSQWELLPGLRVGAQGLARWDRLTQWDEGGFLEEGLLAGIQPDVRSGRWVGLGLLATQDSRNHILNPVSGQYVEVSALARPSFLGSTTSYSMLTAEVRRFQPMERGGTLAFRGALGRATGEVPPLLLPALGGREQLRGYAGGQLRDRALAVAQLEWRTPLMGRLHGALFADAGQVAPELGRLDLADAELSAGAGLRFLLGAGSPIRIDWARGRRGAGLYMTIGHPF